MRILYINHYAGSPHHGMEFRPYYLAREWVRSGHDVNIVAADYSHLRVTQPDLGAGRRRDETIDGIHYTWLKTRAYRGNGLGRVRNIASFVHRLYQEEDRLSAEAVPDVVIASSTYPMDIWPAHRIAQSAGARLIFEIHDLWPLTPMALGGMSKWHPFIMVAQAAENHAYRNADGVVSMLPKVQEHVALHGLPLHRLHIVPNGIPAVDWLQLAPRLDAAMETLLASLVHAGHAIVGYAGNHGVSNALESLLAAAKILRNEKVSFLLVGGGPEKDALERWAQSEQLDNVHFVDAISKDQIPTLLRWFDIAYIGWRRHPLYRFGISPNKLMDYMMAARPVLHAVEAGNDPVGDADCGLTIEPENPVAVVDGIRTLLGMPHADRVAMGERGRDFVLKHFTYPVLGRKFLAACR